jgi:simple sugar transport system permease protein
LQWPLAILVGALCGAIWGSIPGILKAFLNVHEVITSIMLNHIGVLFVNGILSTYYKGIIIDNATNRSHPIPKNARNPFVGLDKVFPNSGADIGIILAIISVIIVYFILKKTVFGKELIAVGSNRHAAKYAGINEKKSIILSMAISGFLAGLGGALFILAPSARNLGNNYTLVNTILSQGFDGIPIALLANSHPIGILIAALFVQYISLGGQYMQSLGFKAEIVNVIIGVILYFSAFSLILGRSVTRLFKRKKKVNKDKPQEEVIKESDDTDSVETLELGGEVK